MIKREKFPTQDRPHNNRVDISCEDVQEILEAKAEVSDPRDLLEDYSDRQILAAQIHLSDCNKCQEQFGQTKERDGPNL